MPDGGVGTEYRWANDSFTVPDSAARFHHARIFKVKGPTAQYLERGRRSDYRRNFHGRAGFAGRDGYFGPRGAA